jgi:hypothetical protein
MCNNVPLNRRVKKTGSLLGCRLTESGSIGKCLSSDSVKKTVMVCAFQKLIIQVHFSKLN